MIPSGSEVGGGGTSPWLVLSIRMPERGEEYLLVEALVGLGARWVEPTGERLEAYFPGPSDPRGFQREVEGVLLSRTCLDDLWPSWRRAGAGEVVRTQGGDIRPRRITPRLLVGPPGLEQGPGEIAVLLAPGEGFGTAGHPTTRSCLRLMEGLVRRGDRIADVGAGSGVLGVAAAHLGARKVLAFESDPLACRAARGNVRLNRVGAQVTVRHERVAPVDLPRHGPFNGLVANVGTDFLVSMVLALPPSLRDDGWAVLSGVPRGERQRVTSRATAVGLDLDREDREDGWWTGLFRRSGSDRR